MRVGDIAVIKRADDDVILYIESVVLDEQLPNAKHPYRRRERVRSRWRAVSSAIQTEDTPLGHPRQDGCRRAKSRGQGLPRMTLEAPDLDFHCRADRI